MSQINNYVRIGYRHPLEIISFQDTDPDSVSWAKEQIQNLRKEHPRGPVCIWKAHPAFNYPVIGESLNPFAHQD